MTLSKKLLALAKTTALVGAVCFAASMSPTPSVAMSLERSAENGNTVVDNNYHEMEDAQRQADAEAVQRGDMAEPVGIGLHIKCPDGYKLIKGRRPNAGGNFGGTEDKCVKDNSIKPAVDTPTVDETKDKPVNAASAGRGTSGGSGGSLGGGGNKRVKPSYTPTISGGDDGGIDCSEANRKARRLSSDLGTSAEADSSMTARGVVVRDINAERRCKIAKPKTDNLKG